MNSLSRACVCGLAIVLTATTSSLAMLKVDFNDASGPSPTYSDWTGVTLPGATGINAGSVGSNIQVILNTDQGIAGVGADDRDRGAANSPAPTALSRDFIFGMGGTDYLEVLVSNVNPGTYTFTGYFHDTNPPAALVNNVETDVYLNGTEMISDLARSDGNEPMSSESFTFTTAGGPLSFRVVGSLISNGNLTAHVINGFTIAAVPEAGAFLVWSVLGGVAVVRYRGKRLA
ncbi:hypothetical protein KOR34_20680 [Posidoniimonas corsicana]|uniref:PEP-CTERM protein-sorting domain-containing protein n=1 Tax=Posidoniimonas corsicana TaxID=1938618 RepID=A0A5C5VG97_9BACT|nr:hypothetical protein [Posidoniimonas corsicana]TWT37121.1 hypothetical protein KOR34_20680 [Posidoniimonas corsicana]